MHHDTTPPPSAAPSSNGHVEVTIRRADYVGSWTLIAGTTQLRFDTLTEAQRYAEVRWGTRAWDSDISSALSVYRSKPDDVTGLDFFDRPNPNPRRRKPMEQLLAEVAERNGDPVWPVELVSASHTGKLNSRSSGRSGFAVDDLVTSAARPGPVRRVVEVVKLPGGDFAYRLSGANERLIREAELVSADRPVERAS